MTTPQDREDEQWLDALAGRPDPSAEPGLNQQAPAVRRALAAQKAEIARQTPKADEVLYQQLLFRMRREGLLGAPAMWRQPRAWAVAASVVFALGIVIRIGMFTSPTDDDFQITRGGASAIVQVVADPDARLAELLAGLRAAGVQPEVRRDEAGRIRIAAPRTEAVVDFLNEQRVTPVPTGSDVVIILEKSLPTGK